MTYETRPDDETPDEKLADELATPTAVGRLHVALSMLKRTMTYTEKYEFCGTHPIHSLMDALAALRAA